MSEGKRKEVERMCALLESVMDSAHDRTDRLVEVFVELVRRRGQLPAYPQILEQKLQLLCSELDNYPLFATTDLRTEEKKAKDHEAVRSIVRFYKPGFVQALSALRAELLVLRDQELVNARSIKDLTTHSERDCLGILPGARLHGVSYRQLQGEASEYDGEEESADAYLETVDLDLGDRGVVTLSWATPGSSEGWECLGLSISRPCELPLEPVRHDVSHRKAWRARIGERVVAIATAWDELEAVDRELTSAQPVRLGLWSLRLEFEGGSVVIALGEFREGELQYSADELVVIHDEALARSYRSLASPDSAWGS